MRLKSLMRRKFQIAWVALLSLGISKVTLAQAPPIPPKLPEGADLFEEEGTVMGVMPNLVQVLTKDKGAWWVQVAPGKSVVKISGTAEPTFLHGGVFVKFSGEINEKGVLQSEVKEMEIVTPTGKASSGVYPSGADEKAKPVNKLEPGTYEIRGRVASFKDGEIQVVAGKKITGKVASDAKIAINMQDFSFVQENDVVKAKGFTYKQFGPDVQTNRPGKAIGTEVEITLANPLTTAPKKGPTKPTKQAKGKSGDAPAVDASDPFGFNKAGGEKK